VLANLQGVAVGGGGEGEVQVNPSVDKCLRTYAGSAGRGGGGGR